MVESPITNNTNLVGSSVVVLSPPPTVQSTPTLLNNDNHHQFLSQVLNDHEHHDDNDDDNINVEDIGGNMDSMLIRRSKSGDVIDMGKQDIVEDGELMSGMELVEGNMSYKSVFHDGKHGYGDGRILVTDGE
ncbi:hypothetical protein HDU76_008997, partial [Blyttiomyces sp. JEL0837]